MRAALPLPLVVTTDFTADADAPIGSRQVIRRQQPAACYLKFEEQFLLAIYMLWHEEVNSTYAVATGGFCRNHLFS